MKIHKMERDVNGRLREILKSSRKKETTVNRTGPKPINTPTSLELIMPVTGGTNDVFYSKYK